MALVNYAGGGTISLRDTTFVCIERGTTVRIVCNLVSIFVPNVVYQWNILERNGIMRRSDISQDRTLVVSPNVTTTYQCIARFISGDDELQPPIDENITISIPGKCYIIM